MNLAELSEPLFLQDGELGLGPVVETDGGFLVSGWFTTIWSDDGENWAVVGGAPQGDDSLGPLTAHHGVTIAVGAHDGATARLYRSEDLGAAWEITDLPADEGTVQIVPHVVSTDDSGFVVAGAGTTSTFDRDVTLYLWTSPDGLEWTVDHVADMGAEFTFTETIAVVDGATVLLAQTLDDRLLAFEQTGDQDDWDRIDLMPVLADQAGISSDLQNARFVGAHTGDGQLTAWWSFNNGNRGGVVEQAGAVVRRTGPREWEATAISEIAPVTVTATSAGFVGTAHFDTELGTTPDATSLVASADGLEWQEIARFDGVALGSLVETAGGVLVVSGATTAVHDEGYVYVTGGGIWRIVLTKPLDTISQIGD